MPKLSACLAGRLNLLSKMRLTIALLVALSTLGQSAARSQTWTPLANGTPFSASQPLLLTDGSVLCQVYFTNNWYRLVPDQFGSYINGTWNTVTPMRSDYGPLYFASA